MVNWLLSAATKLQGFFKWSYCLGCSVAPCSFRSHSIRLIAPLYSPTDPLSSRRRLVCYVIQSNGAVRQNLTAPLWANQQTLSYVLVPSATGLVCEDGEKQPLCPSPPVGLMQNKTKQSACVLSCILRYKHTRVPLRNFIIFCIGGDTKSSFFQGIRG